MEYRRLGKYGLKVSELSLGAWVTFGEQVGEGGARECIHAAYDAGVNYFDNADVYASGNAEVVMGNVMKDIPRTDLVISSKVFWPVGEGPNDRGLSRKHIMESVHGSLERLGTDYLDLYFCHRYDLDVPVEEVVRAMDDLVHQGKVLYWGTSEWRSGQIAHAVGIARQWGLYAPAVEQPQYNMFTRSIVETELVEAAHQHGIGLVTWSPLASGILTGKYNEGIPEGTRLADPNYAWLRDFVTDEKIAKVQQLAKIARELDCTLAQLAIAWLLRIPEVSSVITGASRVSQVHENLKAIEINEQLTPDLLDRIETILDNAPQGH
ncbi:aldo/keto reductase [candidate division KSB3 bacterium]|uniref:Aldo/keto reductase n=1 Tax=candidate division KSB3 bacterium TaxID=2044937 RepID=A0A9D5JXL5_9BACT|nr:aldo/keto reductase [candidate division KSB3 bacterium]MBD3326108.1 aldo/keto reductase [candidate division KSB3 bacterium]